MKNAFVNAEGVLTGLGYAVSNNDDTIIQVDDGFSLQPGAWQYTGGKWVAYTEPLIWASYQMQAQEALDASDRTLLRCIESGIAIPAVWATYRKALRAIVSAASGDVTQPLPTRPAYPTGT